MARIEDYALVGDRQTAALISKAGSVDWLCLPRFDSPAAFAALLGTPANGRWLIGPVDEEVTTTRRYLGGCTVLETTHETPTGTVRVTDAMPDSGDRHDLLRIIEGVSGTVRLHHEWIVRFSYGKIRPWVHRLPDISDYGSDEILVAVAGPDRLILRGPVLPRAHDGRHSGEIVVGEGERLVFEAAYTRSHMEIPGPIDVRSRIANEISTGAGWIDLCSYDGPYAEPVRRSLSTLHALTDAATGGIVAAPTTSLPEQIGGERNWDYRFCWLRDAALTLEALLVAGFDEGALAWRDWLVRAIAGDPRDLQIMYTVDGGRELPEVELPNLPGYENSKPVRIGNAAVGQRQTDVLGEVMVALAMVRELGLPPESNHSWEVQRVLIDELCDSWQQPDHGLWEIRGPRRHFTHSRVMVWAAFDRAIAAVQRHGFPGDVARWEQMRDAVREEIMQRGYNAERGTFTQHYDTDEVDASLLVMAMVGFIDPHDPRYLGTVRAIENDLLRDGLVCRYRPETGVDGLAGGESPFLACSFWLVAAYALIGRLDDAHAMMRRLVGLCNDVGLLSEEYDPQTGRMLGNFPQAFSHLGLVTAAYEIAAAEDEQHELDELHARRTTCSWSTLPATGYDQ